MARRDDAFGGFSAATDSLPAFFTSASVDDSKYESLLEDLRAHDLLGPADGDDKASATTSAASLGGSSLFFNDAFSAVFMGNFGASVADSKPATTTATATASKPPPGFARAPPGLAPTEADLKWARGHQAYSQLASSAALSTNNDDVVEVLDANEIPSLKALGLDDDDVVSPVKKRVAPPPGVPAPSAIPPPPGAWQQQSLPPQHQQQHQQQPHPHQHQHQQYPQPPPPPHGPPPRGMHPQHQHPHPQHLQHPNPQYGYPQGPHGPHGRGPPRHMQHPMHMGHPPPPPPFGMHGPPPPPPHMHMHMRGPHPPHLGPPGPHGPNGMPYPPPMMSMPPPPRFKMMTPRDINFVVQAQTKWIRSSDPFSDDYYFHNYVQKRSRGPVARPGPGGPSGPGGRGLPLPSWKLEHIKSVDTVDSSRAAKSREWETENHVLGRNNTRSLYRPKQLLNFSTDSKDKPSTSDGETATPTTTAESSAEPPKVSTPSSSTNSSTPMVVKATQQVFGSDLWRRREQIDRGLQCLLSLQDARHLLDARGVNVQQFHSMDAQSMDPALAELRTRTTTLLLELASLLGVTATPTPIDDATVPVACDVSQLDRILSVAKGKRLMSRALPLLHPSARFVLLPQLIASLLSADGVSKISTSEASADDEDERLCQTLVLTLLYHPPAPSPELLTECLTRAMHGHDQQTLRVLLYNRGRAEALQALLQRGGASISEAAIDETKAEWQRAQEAFVTLATAIKQAA